VDSTTSAAADVTAAEEAAAPTASGATALPLDYTAAPSTDYEPGPPRRWFVGTLSYTAGGLVVLFCWLLWGDFAWSMKDRAVGPVVQLLLKHFGASDFLTGLLLVSIPPAMTILLVPVFSYRSDRHRGRWGRRIPFLMVPTPIAAAAIVGFAFSPLMGERLHGALGPGRSPGVAWLTLLMLGVFWTIFECATVVANALFGAFVNDVVPRPVLGRFYGMFRAISLIAGMIFNYWIFGKANQHFVAIFLGVGVLYAVGFTIMILKVKEGGYPPPPVEEDSAGMNVMSARLAAVRTYAHDCFTKPYYFGVFAAVILPNVAFLPINTYNLYFSQSVGMSQDIYGKLMALYFGLSLLQTVPLGWLVDRFGALPLAVVALVLHGSASLWGGLFIHDTRTFGIAYVLTGTFSGTWFTVTAAMLLLLLPKRKFAQYASAQGVLASLVTILIGPFVGRFLDYTHHQYRYTYLWAFGLDAAGLIVTVLVFREFQRLGGLKRYVAPET
jgi:MFS family permease